MLVKHFKTSGLFLMPEDLILREHKQKQAKNSVYIKFSLSAHKDFQPLFAKMHHIAKN